VAENANLTPPRERSQEAIVVLKFGGTSVATSDGWRVIAQRINAVASEGKTPLVVHSALAGVSNLLENITQRATSDTH